jgi:hypothetical protein
MYDWVVLLRDTREWPVLVTALARELSMSRVLE